MNVNEEIIRAINLRDEMAKGSQSKQWVRARIVELADGGLWNDTHIAGFASYTRQGVSHLLRGHQRPAPVLKRGRVPAGALDVLLEIRSGILRDGRANPELVQAAVKGRVSTRLLARLTGVPLGAVLYQQRKLRQKEER